MDFLFAAFRILEVAAVVGILLVGIVWLFVSYAVPGKPDRLAKLGLFALLGVLCFATAGELIVGWTRFPPSKLSWLGVQYEHHMLLSILLALLITWTWVMPWKRGKAGDSILIALMVIEGIVTWSTPEMPAPTDADCVSLQNSTASRPANQSPAAPAPPQVMR